jgi:hypothetical protein
MRNRSKTPLLTRTVTTVPSSTMALGVVQGGTQLWKDLDTQDVGAFA